MSERAFLFFQRGSDHRRPGVAAWLCQQARSAYSTVCFLFGSCIVMASRSACICAGWSGQRCAKGTASGCRQIANCVEGGQDQMARRPLFCPTCDELMKRLEKAATAWFGFGKPGAPGMPDDPFQMRAELRKRHLELREQVLRHREIAHSHSRSWA